MIKHTRDFANSGLESGYWSATVSVLIGILAMRAMAF